ncbi:hypothetical protein D3C86_2255480 [compost metagenome]
MDVEADRVFVRSRQETVIQCRAFLRNVLTPEKQVRHFVDGKELSVLVQLGAGNFDFRIVLV